MTAPTLGARYLAACAALEQEPWHSGMSAATPHSSRDGWPYILRAAEERGYAYTLEWTPDLSMPATMGAALGVYDIVRTRSAPDPVYLAATVYGLTAPETQRALVEALERLAAERGAGAGGTP